MRRVINLGNQGSRGLVILYSFAIGILIVSLSCEHSSDAMQILEKGTVTDHEGHVYKTVKIGEQWWMAENLRVTTFRSGEPIAHVEIKEEWQLTFMPGWCTYNNAGANSDLLYNFYTIQAGLPLAPEGWRIPTDGDWKILEAYIGLRVSELEQTNWRGHSEGDLLKEVTTPTTGWVAYDAVWGIDQFGFAATGGSCRVFNGDWGVPGLRHNGYWWSSTANEGYGWFRYLDYKHSEIFRYVAHPNYGFSIRCVKN